MLTNPVFFTFFTNDVIREVQTWQREAMLTIAFLAQPEKNELDAILG